MDTTATIPDQQKAYPADIRHCKHCSNAITGKYCAACGQPEKLKRIDKHYITHEVEHLLHFEKGAFYTAKELFTRPGDSIRTFITEDRSRHMKPVAFLILASLLYTLVAHFFHADQMYNEKERLMFGQSAVGSIMQWVQTHYGYANLIMGVFIALCVQLLFRKYRYNLFEITVLLCYVMSGGMLLLTIEAFFTGLLSRQAFVGILTVISFAYPTWAIGQFFDRSKVFSYIKAFFAYFLGYLLFYAAVIIAGLSVDMIRNA